MKKDEFSEWLREVYNEHTTSSRLSNCGRIEEFEGDLDTHYAKDGGQSLLERLTYSKEDER